MDTCTLIRKWGWLGLVIIAVYGWYRIESLLRPDHKDFAAKHSRTLPSRGKPNEVFMYVMLNHPNKGLSNLFNPKIDLYEFIKRPLHEHRLEGDIAILWLFIAQPSRRL